MSKKSWLGGSDDETKAKDAQTEPTDAQRTQSKTADADADRAAEAPHRNITEDVRSVETDDGSVNPHNEAMAQKPVAIPLNQTEEKQHAPGSPDDLKSRFRAWGRRLRLGGPSSADWEEFERLTGDRAELPSQQQPAPSVPEGARSAVPEGAVSSTTGQRADAPGAKQTRG